MEYIGHPSVCVIPFPLSDASFMRFDHTIVYSFVSSSSSFPFLLFFEWGIGGGGGGVIVVFSKSRFKSTRANMYDEGHNMQSNRLR